MPKKKPQTKASKPRARSAPEELEAIEFSIQKAAEGILWVEADGSISFANEAVLRQLGYTRRQLLGKTLFDIDTNYKKKDWPKRWDNLKQKKEMVVESEHRHKSGKVFPVEIAASFMEHGGEERICAFVRDVTGRKNVEEALRESEEKFRNLAEESPNMIFIHNFQRIAYANRRCVELMGHSRRELYSESFDLMFIIAPESRKLIGENMARHARGENIGAYEYVLLSSDGEKINSVINSRLISFDGRPAILGIVTDISDLKRAEAMMKSLADELRGNAKSIEEKNTALKEILAQIEMEKMQFRKQVSDNVEEYILPILNRMRTRASSLDEKHIQLLEQSLKNLTNEFGALTTGAGNQLTVREMEICNMIRGGLSNKEIAGTLGVSLRTIETHRNNIRKKLGILGKKTQLSAHLMSLK